MRQQFRHPWLLTALGLALGSCATSPGLTVQVVGPCKGQVERNGVVCDQTCTVVSGDVLSASGMDGCELVGWSGGGCSGSESCRPSTAGVILAEFARTAWPFRLEFLGRGSGVLRLDGGGVDSCDASCTTLVPAGRQLSVRPESGPASRFGGFGGDCAGATSACTLVSDSAKRIEASFDEYLSWRLTVGVTGTGGGRISSSPPGINCVRDGGTCSASFPRDTVVTLTAAEEPGSRFVRWNGVLCSGPACPVLLDFDVQATAQFAATSQLTLIADGGTGASVEINGVSFPLPLQRTFDTGSTLRLHALPSPDDTSLGWLGLPCRETRPLQRCTLTLSVDTTGTLKLARFTNWLIGGWSGNMRYNDSLLQPSGELAVLTKFANDSNFVLARTLLD